MVAKNITKNYPGLIPPVALVLGAGGLVPFAAGAVLLAGHFEAGYLGGSAKLLLLFHIYAIAILSFLGGVRWGVAMGAADQGPVMRDYVISVIPALIAWASLLLSHPADLWLLMWAYIALGLLDYGLTCRGLVVDWYGNFRLALSAAVAVCLAAVAVWG